MGMFDDLIPTAPARGASTRVSVSEQLERDKEAQRIMRAELTRAKGKDRDKIAAELAASEAASAAGNPWLNGKRGDPLPTAVVGIGPGATGAPQDAALSFDDLIPKEATKEPAKKKGSADYQRGRTDAGGATRGLLNVMQGPTFGFSDEIAGGLGALVDKVKGKPGALSELYRANRDYARGAIDQASDDNPVFSAVTQGMASLAVPGKKQAEAAQAVIGGGRNILNAVGQGVKYGAIAGLGTSKAEDLQGMAADAGMGAASGGVLSGVAGGAGNVLGAITSNIRQRGSQAAAKTAAELKVAEAIARDARGTVARDVGGNPGTQAAARLERLGPEARIVDSGGQNTRQLLDTTATLPGRTKEDVERAIRARQASRDARLIDAADEALGVGGARLAGTVEGLDAMRRQNAAPLYERLRTMTVEQPSNPLIQAVTAAEQLGATRLGQKMATASQQPYSLSTKTPQNWTVNDLDHVKQGLDTLIEGQIGNTGKMTPLGTKYLALKDALVKEIDAATVDPKTGQSVYEAARAAYSGPSAIISSAEAGRKAMNQDGASIKAAMAGLSEAETQGFRVGAMEALRAKLGTEAGQTSVMKMWKEKASREKLQALFGDVRSYREFASTVAAEARLKGLDQVGRGSQTAARQAGGEDLVLNPLVEGGKALASGNVLGLIGSAKKGMNALQMPEATRDAIGNLLLSGGAQGRENLLRLEDTIRRVNAAKAASARRTGAVTANALNPVLPRD